jgi:protein-tyrosine kinase
MKELALNHLPELAPRTVEFLNLLRLRLEQTAPDAKIILLTSTTPQEGKTTLALQFWQLLAGLGQRCLLVDGDLRHSGICRQCGLTGEHKVPGLAHYLSGSVPLEEVLYHTEIRGTCLVPASGTTSRPALLLEHPRFARMVESCAPKFAYLLVDAPALSECSDALSLAKVCDGALLVVQSGGVTYQELRQAAHLLQGCGLPLLGTVLNRTPY